LDLVSWHPKASVFHDRGWLEALTRTYGFEPFAITTTEPGRPLCNGLVFCRISSWITGERTVSLPFSDHCEPLLSDPSELPEFVAWLCQDCDQRGLNYFELRPLPGREIPDHRLVPSQSYCFHTLDLNRSLEVIFGGLHKDSIQRRIRRASRARLSYEVGRSQELIDSFYRLLILTRRRHHMPVQPAAWFRNLIDCMGENLQISVARKDNLSIAGILRLQHGSTVVYKYGCTDEKYHYVGAMPFLFWKLIEASKKLGATEIDFGRSDLTNQGLIKFKNRFGTTQNQITYFRYPRAENRKLIPRWAVRALGPIWLSLPPAVMPTIGGVIYKHLG